MPPRRDEVWASIIPGLVFVIGFIWVARRQIVRCLFVRRRGCQEAKSKAPVKDPFLGFDFIYDAVFGKCEERFLESTLAVFRRLGPTYTVKRWSWEVLYTSDSRNIKHLLAGAFHDFALPELRVRAMSTFLGRGIFTLDGRAWSHTRSVLKPLFSRLDRSAVVDTLEKHFQQMLALIPGDASPVDLQTLFFSLTMDFACDFITGYQASSMLDKTPSHLVQTRQFVEDYMACSKEVVTKLRLGPLQRLRYSPSASRAKKRVFRFIDSLIDNTLGKAGEGPGTTTSSCIKESILGRLASVTKDRGVLRDQVLHILVASRDTTASVLSNLFFVLSRKPELWRRVREQVLSVAGTTAPTAAQLKQMEYLRWCVDESLRLHPVIPINAREATRDTTLPQGGGPDGKAPLFVAKGVVVMYNTYALHRDERVFGSDPEAFVPERWRDLRPGWGYLPFSGGPRICMGQHLALTEIQYVIARMAQTFEVIEGRGGSVWIELDALATTCKGGVKASLTYVKAQAGEFSSPGMPFNEIGDASNEQARGESMSRM
ncbi:hypothetical protein HIM_01925 [Hirsutella minnesotensis 3608]|nr:hypothetical protein HIM_01925 [Hirsutella minnesotensis 3608]